VRGFWGDIINSPFITFGTEVEDAADRDKFFKQVNFQRIYMASDISAYNVQAYIHKLEKLTKYEYPFERLKHIEKQYEKTGTDPKDLGKDE
jgi:dynein assembly factor 3